MTRHVGAWAPVVVCALGVLTAQPFPVDISLQPNSTGGEMLVVAVVRNLTAHDELRRRNDELARDANILRRLIDVASHELRTPLASGLLDLSRLHNDRLALSIGPVDLAATMQEVVAAFQTTDITITIPSGALVLTDDLRVEQIVSNLLTNAVRYGAAPITIAAGTVDGPDGAHVWLRVCDHGPGIETDSEACLFDAFSQQSIGVDFPPWARTRPLPVTGTRASHGSIIYHANESTGSCFEVRLPAA